MSAHALVLQMALAWPSLALPTLRAGSWSAQMACQLLLLPGGWAGSHLLLALLRIWPRTWTLVGGLCAEG